MHVPLMQIPFWLHQFGHAFWEQNLSKFEGHLTRYPDIITYEPYLIHVPDYLPMVILTPWGVHSA